MRSGTGAASEASTIRSPHERTGEGAGCWLCETTHRPSVRSGGKIRTTEKEEEEEKKEEEQDEDEDEDEEKKKKKTKTKPKKMRKTEKQQTKTKTIKTIKKSAGRDVKSSRNEIGSLSTRVC